MSHWLYQNKPFNPVQEAVLLDQPIGFVYMITNISSGKRYIGKKLMRTTKKLAPLRGKKNKRHRKVETDWRTYTSSSKYVNEDIVNCGIDQFKFEILTFHNNKSELNYAELQCQIINNVLEYENGERKWYNENIACKHYANDKFSEERLNNYKLYNQL